MAKTPTDADTDLVEDIQEENRILKQILGIFIKVVVVDGTQYRPTWPLGAGGEHLRLARGWECHFQPTTTKCEYPESLKDAALTQAANKEGLKPKEDGE